MITNQEIFVIHESSAEMFTKQVNLFLATGWQMLNDPFFHVHQKDHFYQGEKIKENVTTLECIVTMVREKVE